MGEHLYLPDGLAEKYYDEFESLFGDSNPSNYALLAVLLEHSSISDNESLDVVSDDATASVAD